MLPRASVQFLQFGGFRGGFQALQDWTLLTFTWGRGVGGGFRVYKGFRV